MDLKQMALQKHKEWRGKIEVNSRVKVENFDDLSLAYSPGVAEPCLAIEKDEDLAYEYTRKGNLVAVITDGTAVLGLGDIGPSAAMPVMEGKCVLLKEFADVDGIPLCVNTKDPEEFIQTVHLISKSFGGINLEDIAAPHCFEIENRLKEMCDIPIFHDDQHGTAIVTLAATINALKVVDKKIDEVKVVFSGAGAAGVATANLLYDYGITNIIMCNSKGILHKDVEFNSETLKNLVEKTNKENQTGSLADALVGADIFIGVSAPNIVTADMIKSMAKDPIVFAMANPVPEIMPEVAKEAGARVIGTGRSDYPNQVNNVLVFPGIFRGALDARADEITTEMKLSAAVGLAELVGDRLSEDFVLPPVFEKGVAEKIADAVKKAVK